jgi:hypothetical protein
MQSIYNYITWKNMFLRHIVLQLFCSYNLWYMYCYFPWQMFSTFTLALS